MLCSGLAEIVEFNPPLSLSAVYDMLAGDNTRDIPPNRTPPQRELVIKVACALADFARSTLASAPLLAASVRG